MKSQNNVSNKLNELLRDKRGAGMTEYIILVGVIALLALAAFNVFGGQVRDKIKAQGETVESQINDTNPE